MRLCVIDHMDCAHSVQAFDGCDVTHGHTYKVEAVVEGALGPQGFIMDFKDLHAKLKAVLARYDHKNLNAFFDVASCENIARGVYTELKKEAPLLASVRVWEGFNKWAEADGSDLK